jgi:hypothetical protein
LVADSYCARIPLIAFDCPFSRSFFRLPEEKPATVPEGRVCKDVKGSENSRLSILG